MTGSVNIYSLQVLVPESGQFLDLVVPYLKGFFSRSAQGRIDDAAAGWKGRGLWSNYSTYTPHFIEGGTVYPVALGALEPGGFNALSRPPNLPPKMPWSRPAPRG